MDRKEKIVYVIENARDGIPPGELADRIIDALAAPDREPPVPQPFIIKDCQHKRTSGHGSAQMCLDCGILISTSKIKAKPYSLKKRT